MKYDLPYIQRKMNMNNISIYEIFIGFVSSTFGIVVSILIPIKGFLFLILFLAASDLYAGYKSSKKVNPNENFKSKGVRRTIEKIILYYIFMLATEGMRIMFAPELNLAYASAGIICVAEFRSLAEHIEVVTGVPLWKYLKSKFNFINNQKK